MGTLDILRDRERGVPRYMEFRRLVHMRLPKTFLELTGNDGPLAAQLSSGTLLTYDGDGHTAYGRGSACIDSAINEYLLEGTPPKNGKRCSGA